MFQGDTNDDYQCWYSQAFQVRHHGFWCGRPTGNSHCQEIRGHCLCFDVRKSAAEQIESVGGRFIEVDGMDDFEDESGYAKPLTPEFIQKVNDTVCEVAKDADVIITTARIFGRPAPITVPASAISTFKPGSVVVDMNADVGGNCELTEPGEVFTTENGVTIVGTTNLPGELSTTASMLYSNNMVTFLSTLVSQSQSPLTSMTLF